MKPPSIYLITFRAVAVLFPTIALGQLTVDATGPIRGRKVEATMASGGGIGRALPLKITIEIQNVPPDKTGKAIVAFTLTNFSKDELILPISAHPGDFYPADGKTSYSGKCLGLRITFGVAPGIILPGGADLYGSVAFPKTLTTLGPGDSLRVLCSVTLPRVSARESTEAFVANVVLNNETIKTVSGQTVAEMQNIGSASSSEYAPESLLKSHN